MPALFIFLFKVNVALIVFCLGYYLVLKKLTFYTLNRAYLVTAIIFSSVYPLIDLSGFAKIHQLAEPVQNMIVIIKQPATNLVKPLYQPDYWHWATIIFWIGVVMFAFRLLLQLLSLYRLNKRSKVAVMDNHTFKLIDGEAGPFSFWQSIYVNPSNHTADDLKAILRHEQVHVDEWHILDILLAELSTIFYWFNPGVWLMKKAVRENIEFITDRKILQQGADTKAYQYSLLSVGLATTSNTIVNHFNLSTIKKRIIMMNAQRSSRLKLTRYSFVLPVTLLLLSFTISMTDIAKPLTIKLMSAVKPIAQDANVFSAKVIPVKKTHPTLVKLLNQPKNNIDTSVKLSLVTTKNEALADTNICYVNGKKADMSKVDPTKIDAMYILNGKEAEDYTGDKYNDRTHVLLIITKGSDEGKTLKEKLDKRYGKTVGVGKTQSFDEVRINGQPESAKTLNAIIVTGRPMTVQTLKLSAIPANKIDSVHINGLNYTKVTSKNFSTKSGQMFVTGRINDSVRNRINVLTGTTYRLTYDSVSGQKAKTYKAYSFVTNNSRNYKLSDKVIVIDGKEASERKLKKLSAADIETIAIKYDEETEKKYGDKGQNGVVFITTKN